MLKVAIIGLGSIAPIHYRAIEESSNARLVAVCDVDESKKELYPHVSFYNDIDEMLEQETLDCVHICLPHFLHYPMILKCAEKKIHIFTEKPLTLNYQEAEKLFDLEEKYSIKIGVCFQNRYNNTTIRLKELVASKEYGTFLGSKGIVTWGRDISYYNHAPWRGKLSEAGGGVMMNQTIHTLDLLSYLGGEISDISAKISNFSLQETEIEDSVMARMIYKNSNALAVYYATIGYCMSSPVEIEFVFEKAIFKIRDYKLYKCIDDTQEFLCQDDTLAGSKHYYGASHITAIEEFYKAIINNTNHYISIQEGAYAIKLIEGIVQSSNTNQQVQI